MAQVWGYLTSGSRFRAVGVRFGPSWDYLAWVSGFGPSLGLSYLGFRV